MQARHSAFGELIKTDYQNIKQSIFEEAKKKIDNLEAAKQTEKYESLEKEFRHWLTVVGSDLSKFVLGRLEYSDKDKEVLLSATNLSFLIIARLDQSKLIEKPNFDELFYDIKFGFKHLESKLNLLVAKKIDAADEEHERKSKNDDHELLVKLKDTVSAIEGRLSAIEVSLKNLPSAIKEASAQQQQAHDLRKPVSVPTSFLASLSGNRKT